MTSIVNKLWPGPIKPSSGAQGYWDLGSSLGLGDGDIMRDDDVLPWDAKLQQCMWDFLYLSLSRGRVGWEIFLE